MVDPEAPQERTAGGDLQVSRAVVTHLDHVVGEVERLQFGERATAAEPVDRARAAPVVDRAARGGSLRELARRNPRLLVGGGLVLAMLLMALLAPGLDEQSINVTVHEDTLAIEGELKVSVPEGAKAVWQEFGPAKFRRSLRLGAAVDPTRVEAIFRNGLLLVTMPKAEHAKPRQVQVQVSTGSEPTPAATAANGASKK